MKQLHYTIPPAKTNDRIVTLEAVALLSKLSEVKHHIEVTVEMDEPDLTGTESLATYDEIRGFPTARMPGEKERAIEEALKHFKMIES